jgi:putative endonuclease
MKPKTAPCAICSNADCVSSSAIIGSRPVHGAPAGEVDLILYDREGTLVFVEVRARAGLSHGGAAASVSAFKQRRLIYAASHYLLRHASPPPCRFEMVAIDGEAVEWLQAAFDTGL